MSNEWEVDDKLEITTFSRISEPIYQGKDVNEEDNVEKLNRIRIEDKELPEHIHYVDSEEQLMEAIKDLEKQSYISVDTEFLRLNTFYPILCLIQVATETLTVYCFDMCSTIKHKIMVELNKILYNNNIIKVVHSCSQDLEVLHFFSGYPKEVIKPIFDTQLAMQFLTNGRTYSYKELVRLWDGTILDKSKCRSDWLSRPLDKLQIEYASNDVYYLSKVYLKVKAELENKGRYEWMLEESEEFYEDGKTYEPNFKEAFKKVSSSGSGDVYQKKLLCALATWRELKASKVNSPRTWILNDKQIRLLAITALEQWETNQALHAIPNKHAVISLSDAIKEIKDYLQTIDVNEVELEKRVREPQELTSYFRLTVDKIKEESNALSVTENICPSLLFDREEVKSYIMGRQSKCDNGFRKVLLAPLLDKYLYLRYYQPPPPAEGTDANESPNPLRLSGTKHPIEDLIDENQSKKQKL